MDLKGDLENDLKKYLDAPPSQAIPPLSSSNYDDDDDDDDGPLPVIQGFEIDSDEDEDDGDSRCVHSYLFGRCILMTCDRLSLWPHHYNDPRPKPHPLDESGVFCREWGRPSTIMKRGSRGASLAAPLVPQNLFGRQRVSLACRIYL